VYPPRHALGVFVEPVIFDKFQQFVDHGPCFVQIGSAKTYPMIRVRYTRGTRVEPLIISQNLAHGACVRMNGC
jgi:hypothetical protein